MKIDEFIKTKLERLEKFRLFWADGKKENPEGFPDDMGHGEWDHQYLAFDEE